MKRTNVKIALSVILMVLLMGSGSVLTLTGCSGNSNRKIVDNQEEMSSANTDTIGKLMISPTHITAYGNSYTITGYRISKNEQGQIVVTAEGNGFNKLPMIDGRMIIPVRCAFISNGQEYNASSASANETFIDYYFKTSAIPDTLIFYPADDEMNRIELRCK